VGRISPEKGVHVLIDAFKHVLRKYPRIQLDIIGPRWVAFKPFIDPLDKDLCLKKLNGFFEKPASYFQFLKDKLSPADDGKVNFIGAIPHHALLYYYRRSDILINPSLCEAFGMSLVEAMACRCPVIATRVGGMIDIISEGQNGVLVERDDPKALAEAILELLCNPERRQAMGIHGRQKILELFTWQRIADSLFEKYRRLLERQ
jgi:glycosyltransferase involved in cell wall biosynthesis